MPFIECHIASGLSQPRKAQLIRDIVKVTHQSIGSDPHPEANMSISRRIYGEASK